MIMDVGTRHTLVLLFDHWSVLNLTSSTLSYQPTGGETENYLDNAIHITGVRKLGADERLVADPTSGNVMWIITCCRIILLKIKT